MENKHGKQLEIHQNENTLPKQKRFETLLTGKHLENRAETSRNGVVNEGKPLPKQGNTSIENLEELQNQENTCKLTTRVSKTHKHCKSVGITSQSQTRKLQRKIKSVR